MIKSLPVSNYVLDITHKSYDGFSGDLIEKVNIHNKADFSTGVITSFIVMCKDSR